MKGVVRKRRLPERAVARLREDPWRDYPAVGDRAFFRPDSLYLLVTAVGPSGVTSRVTAPEGDPALGEERTVTVAEWVGMVAEGTLLSLPEPPRVGEAWTNRGWGLWFVREVSVAEVVFGTPGGETARCALGPDGLPADRERGWARVNVDTEDEGGEGTADGRAAAVGGASAAGGLRGLLRRRRGRVRAVGGRQRLEPRVGGAAVAAVPRGPRVAPGRRHPLRAAARRGGARRPAAAATVTEYAVGRRVTRYETVLVTAGSREEAVALARRENRFGGAFEEAEYDVLETTRADVVELDGRRRRQP